MLPKQYMMIQSMAIAWDAAATTDKAVKYSIGEYFPSLREVHITCAYRVSSSSKTHIEQCVKLYFNNKDLKMR
jgi:hypothetical protein